MGAIAAHTDPSGLFDAEADELSIIGAIRIWTAVLGFALSAMSTDLVDAAVLWTPMLVVVTLTRLTHQSTSLRIGSRAVPVWVLDLLAIVLARSIVDLEVVGEPLFAVLVAPILAGFMARWRGVLGSVAILGIGYAATPNPLWTEPQRQYLVSVIIFAMLATVGHLIAGFDERQSAVRDASLRDVLRHQAVLSAVVRSDHRGVVVRNPAGHVVEMNEVASRLLGLGDADAFRRFESDESSLPPLMDETGRLVDAQHTPMALARRSGDLVTEQLVSPEDSKRWLAISATPVDAPDGRWVVAQIRDATAETKTLQRLQQAAAVDPLTGVGNRRLLEWTFDAMEPGESVAVILLDLDDFKHVNDAFGHAAGDAVLVGVADRVSKAIRPDDVVIRLGGDEFVAILRGVPEYEAADIATRVASCLDEALEIDNGILSIGATVGWRWGRAGDARLLMREADAAMYDGKRQRHARTIGA